VNAFARFSLFGSYNLLFAFLNLFSALIIYFSLSLNEWLERKRKYSISKRTIMKQRLGEKALGNKRQKMTKKAGNKRRF